MRVFLLSFFALILMYPEVHSQENDGYTMFTVISMKALQGHGSELRSNLKDHNAQFHTEGSKRVSTWAVISGPNIGDLLWSMGPMTYSEMDETQDPKHWDHWRDKVMAHANANSRTFWRLNPKLSYAPEDFQPAMQIARYFNFKEGKRDEAMHTFSSLMGVYKDLDDMACHVFTNPYPGDGEPDMVILWQHESFASLDKNRKVWDQYEKKYEMDGDDFFDNWRLFTEFKGAELHRLIPELSSGNED
jgi:hypothetical protein